MTKPQKQQILSPELPFEKVLELVQPMITSILLKCHIYKDFEYYRHIAAIVVWEAWKKADPEKGLFSSYVYTTVKGEIMKELTREKQFEQHFTVMDDETLNVYRENQLEHEGAPVLLESIMPHLNMEESKLLVLFYLEGYSYAEIANELQLTVVAVKKRRVRLMIKLRHLLTLTEV
ncbi:sigma-70 family RNA polymerase sigma factor [Lysinibacillus parviboronicapiens]|uniref:sigma-70 family RNA polymerase sigma factor n=1 Tax=Lysinibacillus parviboronicapiens TaxID=436516 RepID=UPI000D379F6C|nr:sigma-70 family RNA polymerase sigma factor [Lysinibacillus parviboronicapiens]